MKTLVTTLTLFLFSLSGSIEAQETDVKVLENSTIKIEGTSNVHDWTAKAEQIRADIRFHAAALQEEQPASPVQSLWLVIPANRIESGKSGMNRKMYDALKVDKHPQITFELTGSELKRRWEAGPIRTAGRG